MKPSRRLRSSEDDDDGMVAAIWLIGGWMIIVIAAMFALSWAIKAPAKQAPAADKVTR